MLGEMNRWMNWTGGDNKQSKQRKSREQILLILYKNIDSKCACILQLQQKKILVSHDHVKNKKKIFNYVFFFSNTQKLCASLY